MSSRELDTLRILAFCGIGALTLNQIKEIMSLSTYRATLVIQELLHFWFIRASRGPTPIYMVTDKGDIAARKGDRTAHQVGELLGEVNRRKIESVTKIISMAKDRRIIVKCTMCRNGTNKHGCVSCKGKGVLVAERA